MKKILVAIDFSLLTKTVIEKAKEWAQEAKAEVCIVHTEEPPAVPMGVGANYILFPVNIETEDVYVGNLKEVKEQEEKRTRSRLNEIKCYFEQSNIKAEAVQLSGDIAEMILNQAKKIEADVIMVGAHDHGPLYHLFFGSVRESLVRSAECPIIVIPESMVKTSSNT